MAITLVVIFLVHFNLIMYLLALVFIMIDNNMHEKIPNADIAYRWISLLCLSFPLFYSAIINGLFPSIAGATIGFTPNPYHMQIAALELVYGLFVAFSFRAKYGYRMVVALSSLFILWTDVAAHIAEVVQWHHYPHGNAISWLFIDFSVPLILFICVRQLKPR